MIEANHKFLSEKGFYLYVMHLFKSHFHTIHLLGEMPHPSADLPLLILPNHNTWWDGLFVYLLNKKIFRRKFYLMMLEEELVKFRFFAKIGSYSVEPKSPKSLLKSLKYTVSLLQQPLMPRPILFLFPEGDLHPWNSRPINYKKGIEWLLEKYAGQVNILPLAIRTEFLAEQRPEAFFLFGQNYQLDYNTFPGVNWLEEIENNLLADLTTRIAQSEEGQILLRGSRSVNEIFVSFMQPFRSLKKKFTRN